MMRDPLPAGALVPAPVIPPALALRPVDPAARLAHQLTVLRALQDARDDHEARCLSRALVPNPCHVLWSLDERMRSTWAEVVFLGGGLVDLYQPRPCPPECSDCAEDLTAAVIGVPLGSVWVWELWGPDVAAFTGAMAWEPHHAARCPVPDGDPCTCEAPVPAVAL